MEILNLLNPQLILAQIVCFFLVLVLLKLFLWKPVFVILEARRERVAAELKAIENTKGEVTKLKGDYETVLAKVEELTNKRIKEAETLGEIKAQEIRERARLEAERIVEDARKEISFEIAKSRDLLKGEIVEMIIQVTERMIQEKLTFDSDKKIVEGILKDLDKTA